MDFGLDFDEIVVVNNPLYDFMGNEQKRSMVNMHLDTYFNLADRDLAITSEELCSRAGIDIYYRDGDVFTKAGSSDLLSFLREKGFEIINLRISEQMSYSSNFLTISPSKIVAVKSSSVLEKLMSGSYFPENLREAIINDLKRNGNILFPENRDVKDRALDVQEIDLSEITGGYGGAHCMTATLKRG